LAGDSAEFPASTTLNVAKLYAEDSRSNQRRLEQLLVELDEWLESQLGKHGTIALLGSWVTASTKAMM
jgi:hypothetical protein